VDHAHLHLVPWNDRFADTISRHSNCDFSWRTIDGCDALRDIHAANLEYLYFEEADGASFVAVSDAIPSQFFRRVIASAIGLPHLFDWKRHSGIEAVNATVAALRESAAPLAFA
jgi:hypothetical protein